MLKVNSEIGRLKTVLLHEPDEEINNLVPKYLEELLFDDIPWLPLAKQEHQAFAQTFRDAGVKVVYITGLVSEALDTSKQAREEFIEEFMQEASLQESEEREIVREYLNKIKDNKELVKKTVAGIKSSEIPEIAGRYCEGLFVTMPMPNLYFARDPFVIIGEGVSLNKMYSVTRCRETIYGKYIFRYHPEYCGATKFYDRTETTSIEGGDILVLSNKTLLIGVSQRTELESIEKLAKNLFYDEKSNYETIIAISIPKFRTFMHLDTVFTQVDYDKFLYHKESFSNLRVFSITKDKDCQADKRVKCQEIYDSLENILKEHTGREITLIPCGGDDSVCADREQWSDGSNCVVISPGEVIAYARNNVTNEILKSYGIKVHTVPSSELSRGRGGPRCMCMPLEREKI